jgi:hypothetical protein
LLAIVALGKKMVLFVGKLTSIGVADVVIHIVDDEASQTDCHGDDAEREDTNQADPLPFP